MCRSGPCRAFDWHIVRVTAGCKAQSFFLYLSFLCLLRHRREDATSRFLILPLVCLWIPPLFPTWISATRIAAIANKQALCHISTSRYKDDSAQDKNELSIEAVLASLSSWPPWKLSSPRNTLQSQAAGRHQPCAANLSGGLNMRPGGGVGRRRGGDNSQLQFCSAAAAANAVLDYLAPKIPPCSYRPFWEGEERQTFPFHKLLPDATIQPLESLSISEDAQAAGKGLSSTNAQMLSEISQL